MKYLVLRNLRLYFRDKISIMFSMMAVMITIGLYVFFLADTMSSDLNQMADGKTILYTWLLAGLLSTTSVTTTLASFGVMISDRYQQIMKDFYASSVSRNKLMLSYIFAACITGIVMSLFTLVIGEIFIVVNGGAIMQVDILLKTLGMIILSVGAGSSIMFFLASFLNTSSAFSNASTLVGTLIGFLMGIYIPIGALPSFAQTIIKVFPLSHGCAAMRSIMVNGMLEDALQGTPANLLVQLQEQLGNVIYVAGEPLSIVWNLIVLTASLLFFYIVSLAMFKMKQK